jgi:hypothetical protein
LARLDQGARLEESYCGATKRYSFSHRLDAAIFWIVEATAGMAVADLFPWHERGAENEVL